jgi:hypothetical protein
LAVQTQRLMLILRLLLEYSMVVETQHLMLHMKLLLSKLLLVRTRPEVSLWRAPEVLLD